MKNGKPGTKKSVGTLYKKGERTMLKTLLAIQQTFRAVKDQRNEFGGFNYRNVEVMLTELKPILAEHEACITFSDEIIERGGRCYVEATATLTTPKGEVSCKASAREQETKKGMDAAQITGACSTYARKYALCGLLAVDDGSKDPDANKHIDMISKAQVKTIVNIAEQKGSDLSAICDYFNVGQLEEMTTEDYAKCLRMLEQKGNKNG